MPARSLWISNTMVESHAYLDKSKSLPKTVKHRRSCCHCIIAVLYGRFANCNEGRQVGKRRNCHFLPLSSSRSSTQGGTLGSGWKSIGRHLILLSEPLYLCSFGLLVVPVGSQWDATIPLPTFGSKRGSAFRILFQITEV